MSFFIFRIVSLYIVSYWTAKACASDSSSFFLDYNYALMAVYALFLNISCWFFSCSSSSSFSCLSCSTNLLSFYFCSSSLFLYLSLLSCYRLTKSSSIFFFCSSILSCSFLTRCSISICFLSISSSCLCLSIYSLIFYSSKFRFFSYLYICSTCCWIKMFFFLYYSTLSFFSSSSSNWLLIRVSSIFDYLPNLPTF